MRWNTSWATPSPLERGKAAGMLGVYCHFFFGFEGRQRGTQALGWCRAGLNEPQEYWSV
jgi:hypothetical protein